LALVKHWDLESDSFCVGLQNGGGTAIDQNFDGENRGHEDVVNHGISDDFGVSCFQTNQPPFGVRLIL
jgi:hypothetical protein